jgi:hypothetical protein
LHTSLECDGSIITGLTSGSFYDIKVQAFNIVGGFVHSGAIRLVAATKPSALENMNSSSKQLMKLEQVPSQVSCQLGLLMRLKLQLNQVNCKLTVQR